MVQFASQFTHILVIVGDNDAKSESVENILKNYLAFENGVWPSRVKFVGHMRRNDLSPKLVQHNNSYLSEKLGYRYKSPRTIKRKDFGQNPKYHFSPYAVGCFHISALILSVFQEFVTKW